jgi:polysaccharide biosynthesis protein PslH
MKVLGLVTYSILPAKIGGQKDIALFYKYFSREVPFLAVSIRKNDPAFAEGYEMLNILSDGLGRYINPLYFFTLRRIIRQYQVTHLELEHPYYGWMAVLLKWFTGVKLIVHSHNIEGTRFKSLGKWWWKGLWYYEKWTHRRADHSFFKQDDDREYAIRYFGLLPQSCITTTYGIEWNTVPAAQERKAARETLRQQHGIPAHHRLLLFNGAFNYLPNLNGLRNILEKINPELQTIKDFHYTILICGKDIPAGLAGQSHPNVIFAGFVPDISLYFKGSDVFLNPVVEGGGIKTKLVEALGHNMNAVSSQNGAIGVDPAICNGKLVITDDALTGFSKAVVEAAWYQADQSPAYFEHFYWGNIAQKAARFIQ